MQCKGANEANRSVFVKQYPTTEIFCAGNQILGLDHEKNLKTNSVVIVKGAPKQTMHFINLQNFVTASTHPSSSLQRKEKRKTYKLHSTLLKGTH